MSVVLHLEDEGTLQEIFKFALSMADRSIMVKQFVNGDHAFEYIHKNLHEIDVFVLDIRVPGSINGLHLGKQIRYLGSKKPIVLTSAFIKPAENIMKQYEFIWMPKPMHVVDTSRKILPLINAARSL